MKRNNKSLELQDLNLSFPSKSDGEIETKAILETKGTIRSVETIKGNVR